MLIAQITDCHVVEDGQLMADRVDTAATLKRVIGAINAMEPRVDLVLATGDLVNDGLAAQYDRLMSMLQQLGAPVIPIPGNHDDRTEMRRSFPGVLPGGGPDDPLDLVIDEHPLRLIGLDTTKPPDHGGRLSRDQLGRLDELLSADPERPAMIFQHHPPFESGITWMDVHGFDGAMAEREVLSRHHNVEALVCGHLHQSIQTRFANTVASCWPSTGAQLALDLHDGPITYADTAPAFALHRWSEDAGVVSHLVEVSDHATWTPSWARTEHEPS